MPRQKPKVNRGGDKDTSNSYDRCQTPFYALDPLIKYLDASKTIWESAMGEGLMVQKLQSHGFNVVGSDILSGSNFFDFQPSQWDIQVTNPPFSVKYDWIERSYQLGKPFALIMPLETLGAGKAQKQFKIHGIEIILLNKRVNYKMPNKGYKGSGSMFPSAWFTSGLGIGAPLTYETISYYPDSQTRFNFMEPYHEIG